MKNITKVFLVLLSLGMVKPLYSQDQQASGLQLAGPVVDDKNQDPLVVADKGTLTSTEHIITLVVENFENAYEWTSHVSKDYGNSIVSRREGAPIELQEAGSSNGFVLGVKMTLARRGWTPFRIEAPNPIQVRGVTKELSAWVVGRGLRQMISFITEDILGREQYLETEYMTWIGWKEVIAPVPPILLQREKGNQLVGLSFVGFNIDLVGSENQMKYPYYTYFDYVTAKTDIYDAVTQDDMIDLW